MPAAALQHVDELEHRHGRLGGEVEGLARERRVLGEAFGELQVGQRAVDDVEVVAHQRAVGADDRALAPSSSERMTPGTRRSQFTSPGPKKLPQRVMHTGTPHVWW